MSAPPVDQDTLKRMKGFKEDFNLQAIQPSIIDNRGKVPLTEVESDRWSNRPDTATGKPLVAKSIAINGQQNVTNDNPQGNETSVVSVDISSTTYVTTAYIRDIGSNVQNISFYTTTPTGTQSWSGNLPIPTGYTRVVDPYLAVNQSTSGVNPSTIYLVALAIDNNSLSGVTRAVVGYASHDGGKTWIGPGILDTEISSPGGIFMDKPHVIVSELPATLGYVYISYRQAGGSLVMRRSIDGGVNFEPIRTITNVNVGAINGVQMAASPYNNILGYVCVNS